MADRRSDDVESVFAFIAEHTSDVIVRISASGVITYISPGVRRYGYEPEEIIGTRGDMLVHPDDAARLAANSIALVKGELDPTANRQHRFRTADGGWGWLEGNPHLVFGDDGQVVEVVNIFRDVTARRAAEAALKASEARYRLLAENSEDVTAQIDLMGVLTYLSPAVRAYGYEADALVGTSMRTLVHPDDLQRAQTNLAAALAGEPSPSQMRQLRFRTAAGDWVWMESSARATRDRDGLPTGFVTSLRNVTERREQEALFEAAFDHAAIGRTLVDMHGRILRANQATCEMMGYTEAELQALPLDDLIHPDEDGTDSADAARLQAGEIPRYESTRRYRRADGTYLWVRMTVALVRYADGRPKHYVAEVEDLTERRAAEAALRDSEERYRLIAENTSDLIVMSDLTGRATYASQAVRKSGRRPEDIEGRSFAESVHPEDVERLTKAFTRLVFKGRVERVRWRGRDQTSGDWAWMESNPSLLRDPQTGAPTGFLDVIRNVQGQVEQEEALARAHAEAQAAAAALHDSEARYRLIGDNTSDIIVMAEPNGRISFISPSCASIGYSPDELVGTAFAKQMHPDDIAGVWGALKDLPPGATAERMRWRALNKATGQWVWLESQPTMLKDPATGGPAGFLDVVRDVTRQVEQEEALAGARAEAEAAAAAKSQFLANMSHEIRTPLTAVLGFTSLLQEVGELPEAAAGYVERIAGAGKGLLAIVNDILDFSKLEAGKFEVRPRPTDVAAVCEETLLLFSTQAEAKGLTLAFEAAPGLPKTAMLDADRLRQSLINLIGNAVKFTEAGGVTLTLAPAAQPDAVAIAVADTGPGLDEEAQARLFQRFTQIDGSMTRRHGGTGLGLAICRGVAEAMGGTIGVTSTLGEGATFHLVLPAPAVEAPQELAGEDAPLSIDGTRVFVVDDNATNRELARRILEAAGAEVAEAADGAEAVERLALLPVDVVLMDLRMPGLDGRGALALLRATPGPNQDVPVLAFTADADVQADGDLAGFDGLVRKPIQPLELYGAIAAATQWPLEDDDVSGDTNYAAG